MPNHKVLVVTPDQPRAWLCAIAESLHECRAYQQWSQQHFTEVSMHYIERTLLMPASHQADMIDMFCAGVQVDPLS